MFCQNIINILVIKKLLYHYNQRFWRLTLLCSRLHCKWVHVMAKKEIIKAIVNFQFGLHLSGYNCFLADYFVTAEAWYFPNKTELASRKTVLLITLVVNYCPHTYYLCQFLWAEVIAVGQMGWLWYVIQSYIIHTVTAYLVQITDTIQLINKKIKEQVSKFHPYCLHSEVKSLPTCRTLIFHLHDIEISDTFQYKMKWLFAFPICNCLTSECA